MATKCVQHHQSLEKYKLKPQRDIPQYAKMAKIKKTDYTSVDELGELILYIAGGSTV